LKSSRTNPFKVDGGVETIKDNLAANGIDALVAIGGEDTLGVATKLADAGVNVEGLMEVSICQGQVTFTIADDKLGEARTTLGNQVIG
jgi:6-phosphofructokinase